MVVRVKVRNLPTLVIFDTRLLKYFTIDLIISAAHYDPTLGKHDDAVVHTTV
jgi:hypothetical protein